jgi:hypothetical protein
VATPVGEKRRLAPIPRATAIWGGLLVLVIVGFVVVVSVLNATVYSAGGFVRGYLDALNRGDTTGALALAGVTPTTASGDSMLAVPEKGRLLDIHQVADQKLPDGSHRITVGYRTADEPPAGTTTSTSTPASDPSATPGSKQSRQQNVDQAGHAETEHTTQFAIRRSGTIGGLFGRWEFQVAPTASLDITSRHDAGFTANGRTITSPSVDLASRYAVLAPAVVDLSHSSTYLTAATVRAVADKVGGVSSAAVDVEPRASFVHKVRTDVTNYLRTTCLPQKVLLPAGCPFGESIDDRLTSAPAWSMTSYPPVRLLPTGTTGTWSVAAATGHARLKVGAQSLYDGHAYSVDQDVPFVIAYQVVIGSDEHLTLTPQAGSPQD